VVPIVLGLGLTTKQAAGDSYCTRVQPVTR
jgi:hypothetical protein